MLSCQDSHGGGGGWWSPALAAAVHRCPRFLGSVPFAPAVLQGGMRRYHVVGSYSPRVGSLGPGGGPAISILSSFLMSGSQVDHVLHPHLLWMFL